MTAHRPKKLRKNTTISFVTLGETSFTATLAEAKSSEEPSSRIGARFGVSCGMAIEP
jgi:hypothetical protein